MEKEKQFIDIKDKKIQIKFRNYKNMNTVKMFFRGEILNISKPYKLSYKKTLEYIKKEEIKIYNMYSEIISKENNHIRHWDDGEMILYEGEKFKILIFENDSKNIKVKINLELKKLEISIPKGIEEEHKKYYIKKIIKDLFKNNTIAILQKKLPYWSEKMNIKYSSFKVRDKSSNFGTCKPKTGELSFNSRIIMLSNEMIDAIIVHELSHMVYPNHSKDFYGLVKTYIPNYDKINKWLKENITELII